MAEPDLIDAYLAQLDLRLGRRRTAADDLAEAADHIREAAEQLERTGLSRRIAQERALERFGDPTTVARALSLTSNGGIAMPSTFTRSAGTAAVVAAAAWLVAATYAVLVGTADANLNSYLVFAAMVAAAGLLSALTLVGLVARSGGGRDASSLVVVGMVSVAAIMLLITAWAWIVWVQLLAAAALIAVLKARRAHVRSSATDWLAVLAWPASLATFVIADRMRLGDVDTYGDYPAAASAALVVGAVLFAAGLIPLGRWLRSEPVAAMPDPVPAA